MVKSGECYMLLGLYEAKLTDKGRLALPKKFRKQLGENVIIARWYETCLVVVGKKEWEELLSKLTGKAEFITRPVRDTDRFILGSAFEVDLDKQGRFVVPRLLKDYAGLRSEVVFLGLGNRVEIWSKKNWSVRENAIQKQAESLVEKIAEDAKVDRRANT